ncbi:peptidoglycan -binding protein [Rhodovulum sulfidophilum]|uniref:peptidoglycan -binding protein n=1 Tax=Rhodovulum sulfidophilum TaxID=35806 RepID=UPI0019245682|nr:peptidoglycan -binding protein [Rhodovulum sulfidophilum]MBL3575763.1 peptidoglycan -binding protein [Rhodovulum sulfidophilum]MCF4115629.1 peptidoglycan -binding protein [Rhodovulum sulfidophilum]
MALTRRSGGRFQAMIWPGFVDAMTALLLVLMFVLSIFMLVQEMLRETITGQESELTELNTELAALADALGMERRRASGLEEQVGELGAALTTARSDAEAQAALIASLTDRLSTREADLAAAETRIGDIEDRVARLVSERDAARARGETLEGELAELEGSRDRLEAALASTRQEVDAQAEAARLAAARREALEALVADLRARNTEAETARATLEGQVESAEAALSQAEKDRLAEAAAAAALRDKLAGSEDELSAMSLALEQARQRAEDTLTLLAAAEKAREQAATEAEGALSEADRRAALLAVANERLETEEAKSAESQRKVALLNRQMAALRGQLGELQGLLDDAQERDAAARVQIETLGSKLNAALARVASEQRERAKLEEAARRKAEEEAARLEAEKKTLEGYRSEFFGRMRALLAGREGVRIVGDRFVFSSEVLFETGKADLSGDGEAQIANVVAILRGVADEIPPDIDWILRIDGHTDDVPLARGADFADNWELSQARALSVVRYMIDDLGFPPDRLAAAGFGQYQPVAAGKSPEARAQNRRIELKLTER